MVYRLVASDTIEEKVMELKARKGELVASILDAGLDAGLDASPDADVAGSRATEALTADDLRALLEG